MIAWRICKSKRAATALTGEGAAKSPGRWNSAGRHVVYLGQSRALAAMEVLVHVEDFSLLSATEWVAIPVEFDAALVAEAKHLPADWDAVPAPATTHAFGDRWFDAKHSLLLRVPSIVVKGEFNFLLNTTHADVRKVKVGKAESFRFDQRIVQSKP